MRSTMKRRVYLREWRRKARLTQKQVVEQLQKKRLDDLPLTEASLSRAESGEQNVKLSLLFALADIYKCRPGDLLDRDPAATAHIIDMIEHMDEGTRHVAEETVTALAERQHGFRGFAPPAAVAPMTDDGGLPAAPRKRPKRQRA